MQQVIDPLYTHGSLNMGHGEIYAGPRVHLDRGPIRKGEISIVVWEWQTLFAGVV